MKIYLYSIVLLSIMLQSALCDDTAKKKELNDAMAERAGLMVKTHQVKEKLSKAWADKELTSPEIEKLRERYEKLKFEMMDVREKLKAEVRKHPQVQKQEQEVEEMQVKQKALEKRIEELNKK